ncbi:MAG TPA: PAS domain-containing protein, partial [Hymenobacter sp.]
MSSIALRHIRRQLQWARRVQVASTAELRLLREHTQEQDIMAASQASALLQTMSTAIIAINKDRVVNLVNQRTCSLFGLPESCESYSGQHPDQLIQKATNTFCDLATVLEKLRAVVASQQQATGLLATLLDGKVVQCDYLPIVQDGQTILHLWSFEDVTLQQQTQKRVQELSRLAEQSPYPIIHFSRSGQALYANSAAESVLSALAAPAEQACQAYLLQEIAESLAHQQTRTSERQLA